MIEDLRAAIEHLYVWLHQTARKLFDLADRMEENR